MPALISSALHVAAAHLQRVPLSTERETLQSPLWDWCLETLEEEQQ